MSDVQQQMHEPQIIASDLTNDELFGWMGSKVANMRLLKSAMYEKTELEKSLALLNEQIESLTIAAAIEFVDQKQDPTPDPKCHQMNACKNEH
ncbi:hypothetical protein ASF13_06420 [Erwinia sp. Leaf53]|nr:hypothetical protein ASF13_06420 [Erwinia sp. Leaf53]